MKEKIRISLLACTAIVATQVHAQNTVTLYGIVDTGLMYVHNSGGKSTQIALTSGNESGSRFGLKGAEDLGGGLKAVFQLENGFNSTNGAAAQGGRMFGRQAFVGLSGATWGTLTTGRQYDPLVDFVQPVQGDNYLGGFFTSPGDIDNADNSIRINNSVKWASPNWGGLQLSAIYSFGGIAGAVGSGQTYAGAATYSAGSFTVAAGYQRIDNGNATVSTRGTTSADSLFNSSVNKAYSSARSIDITRAGGNYVIGAVTIGGYYSFSQYNADASSTFTKSEKYNNGEIYAVWQVLPTLSTQIGYDYMKSSGDSSAKQHQFALAADYSISKRTDVYGVLAYAHATGQNGTGAAQAVIGSTDIDSGSNNQALALVGIRHRF
ncbi:porin [Paraburkholderia dipogonis]|uniref:Porin n=1 Tax=Paraburkholderia dipogonis TaxID=1211383 RepID=A0A4Y8MX41_9BURK|nr:porin [Paraburkholderia dipogonis]TFE41962.1 porin [Paraburkholderia dipogonis]